MKFTAFPPLIAFAILIATSAAGAPIISEFQADNEDTIKDEDGSTSDWIEIYNPDATAVDLAGMALTDDPLLPQKWVFPAISIPARSHLLVWASVKNRTNPANPLHTNFDLAAAGEYLALMAADGTTKLTEFNTYPPQPEDRSYGSSNLVIVTEVLVASGAACKWTVPSGTIPGWETPGFVDTAWTSATTGIGYDGMPPSISPGTVDFNPLIGSNGNTRSAMFNIRASCYIRVPFTLNAVPADVTSLKLRIKYEDGFAAFLNGTRLSPPTDQQTNVPLPPLPALAWNSTSNAVRSDSLGLTFDTFDITPQKGLLFNGANVLAIQALNQSTTSSDLIIVPELEVTRGDSSGPTRTGYFVFPTPGAANTETPADGFVDDPEFSTDRGFYTTPIAVTLTTDTPQATIRYTINGSAPTATTGTPYTVPVQINTTTVLRAVAFRTGWHPSVVDTHTYVFAASVRTQPSAPAGFPTTWGYVYNQNTGQLDPVLGNVPADYLMDPAVANLAAYTNLVIPALTTTLPVISLTGDVADIFEINGIYSNGRLSDTEIPVGIEFFDPNSTDEWATLAGLRMHGGNAPTQHPKKPFRIYFRTRYGGVDRLRTGLYPGSPVDEFDVLQLRPGGHDGWSVPFGNTVNSLAYHATYARDQFVRQTEKDMGRVSPAGRYVHLYINGLYWGLYNLHEVPNAEYFATHLGGEDEDWDVVQNPRVGGETFANIDGNNDAFTQLLALSANISVPGVYEQIQDYLDIDAFIDHMIVQMWSAQNDWMGPVFRPPGNTEASWFFNKNWDCGRRSRGSQTTGFFFNCWDGEIAMGASLNLSPATQRTVDFNHTLVGSPSANGNPGPPADLYHALRQHPPFRARFGDRLQKHFFNGGAMTTANNQARLLDIRTVLELPIVPESIRWGDVNGVDFTRDTHWAPEMDWLRDTYLAQRNDILLQQFRDISLFPSVTAPSYSQFGGSVPSGYQLTITDPNAAGGTVYYTLDGTDPMGSIGSEGNITLLGPGMATAAQYIVPEMNYSPGNYWKNVSAPSDIANWSTGPVGLGFDANPTFGPHIVTTVTGMQNVKGSLYVRIPFSVTAEQKAALASLTLKLKYDDGAYVFLNGSTPLYRLNTPSPTSSPLFSDLAGATRLDTDAVVYQGLDLTPQISTLTVGSNNVLAIQGLNFTADDDDFLCVPELVGTTAASVPPSATAVTYTGPVTLPQSGTVMARVLKDGVWSPLTDASFIVGQPASDTNLTITEFSYNPVASAAELLAGYTNQMFEYIELMNISGSPVELTGCRFDDGISFDFVNSSVQTIGPGARILLVSNQAAFAARHPGIPVAGVFANASNLSNAGERLELLAANGSHIFDFVFNDTAPWPTSPDGMGTTLVLINPMADPSPSVPANWRASVAAGGTPGSSDADSFAAWAARNGVAGGMSDDSDANGLTNLAEYGLGLTPSSAEADGILSAQFESVTVAGVPDTYLVLRFRRNFAADDVIVRPEMSTDITNWTPLTDAVPPEMTNPDGTEDLARRSPLPVSTGSRVLVRVSVTTR